MILIIGIFYELEI